MQWSILCPTMTVNFEALYRFDFAERHKILMLNEPFEGIWTARISHNGDQNSSRESSKSNVMGCGPDLA